MSKPSGKLLMAYRTIADLEQKMEELRALLAEPAAQHQGEPVAMQWQYERGSVWWAFDAENVSDNIASGTKIRLTDAAGNVLFRHPAEQPAPVSLLANGFTTLETGNRKYKIVTEFPNRDDAWSAYTALVSGDKPAPVAVVLLPPEDGRRTSFDTDEAYQNGWNACLDKVKELNP